MRRLANYALLIALAGLVGAVWAVPRVAAKRNYEFLPNMVSSVADESYATPMRPLPAGVVVRGVTPLHYTASKEDAARAGEELRSPLPQNARTLARGAAVYATYCQVCHGPAGMGDGAVSQRGFPAPPSFLADNAMKMKDGQIFHVMTYGQNNMPSYAAQVPQEDRWAVVAHVRQLQGIARPAVGGATR